MAENISIKQEKEKETKEKRLKPEEEKEESTPRKNVPAKITIPQARFVLDVDKFMQEPENSSAEVVLKRLDEQHTKYKFLEANLLEKKKRLRHRIPDIQKSLDMIKMLKSKQDLNETFVAHYPLSGGVHTIATVPPTKTVFLWLGANVMLEYPIDDAAALLEKNLKTATTSIEEIERDVDFITDQCTTIEVAVTRVYNWDVKDRREKKLKQLT